MDGVAGLSFNGIPPGKTYACWFTERQGGMFEK